MSSFSAWQSDAAHNESDIYSPPFFMHIDFLSHTFVNTCKSLSYGMKKPDRKFVRTFLWSMLEYRTPVLSRLWDVNKMNACHILKYFSRNLGKTAFKCLPERIFNVLVKFIWKPHADACFCFDSVDLNKNSAEKMQGLTKVRDGSTGTIVNGYVCNAVSVWGIPLFIEREKLVEIQEDGSEKTLTTRYDIFETQVKKIVKLFWTGYWILADRLYDDVKKFNLLLSQGFRFAIRLKTTRYVTVLSVKQGDHTLTHTNMKVGELPEGYYEVTFPHLSRPCFLMVKHKKWCKNPIRVLSSEDDPLMIEQYLKRWEIERIFKSGKQEYDFEKIGVYTENKIDILIAIIQLSLGISAYTYNTVAPQHIERKKRRKPWEWSVELPVTKAVISTLQFRQQMKQYLEQVSLTFNRNSIIGFIAKYMSKIRRMKYVQNRVTLKGSISAQLSFPW
jgi:Transposase DDE domain